MGRQQPIWITDFIGGLNTRDVGHLLATNEATQLDCGWFPNKALRSFPGERRRLLDAATYPPIAGMSNGTAGGVPNDEPILGHSRYYYDEGGEADAWVRVHGNIVEYWPTGGGGWIQIGQANWPNTCIPTFCQFQNTMLIMHGTLNTYYMCKFLTFNGNTWVAGDVPVPGFYTLGAVNFTGVGLNDMTAAGPFTGSVNRFFLVQVRRNLIEAAWFNGGGLNDMVSGGAYVGANVLAYHVRISAVGGLADEFEWSDDGGLNWSAPVAITGAAQALSNGVTVTFGAVLGHTLGDYWGFECGPTDAFDWSWDGGATWQELSVPMIAGFPIGLDEGITVTFAAAVGHTVGDYWEFDVIVNDLPNLRPAFAASYKGRVYAVSPNEPYRLRFSAVNNPRNWLAPAGGYVGIGEEKGDPIRGLFVNNGRLYIFKRHSVWIYWIDDYGIAHIYQHRASGGLLNSKCICALDDIIYYLTDRGMYMLYGADYDCVSDKVHPSIEAHPEYLKYAQCVAHLQSSTIWATYLVNLEEVPVSDSEGTGTVYIFHTHTWVGQARRGLKTRPRWTRLPYYRITGYAFPPGCNNYRGNDAQNLRFDGQQPDKTEWNPNNTYPDILYPTPAQGGPLHYSYAWNTTYDRDQVPAIAGYYAGDRGIGWHMKWRSKRFFPIPTTRNVLFDQMRLEYNVWKPQAAQGMDAGWGRVLIDEEALLPSIPEVNGDDHFSIENATPFSPDEGGWCFQEWSLAECRREYHSGPGAYGKSIMVEIECCGTSNRNRWSYAIEFKDIGIEWDIPETDMTPDRG